MSVRPYAVWTASFLFAVTGPSMKLKRGPPVLLAQAVEDALALPPLEHLQLERGMIGDRTSGVNALAIRV